MRNVTLLFLFSFLFFNCGQKALTSSADDGKIEVVLLQLNDVYEIAPLEGGKKGGMARVTTLKKQLMQENPNVLVVHAGDFLSPSLMGTLSYQNEGINGRQMVEVMNQAGIDIVAFGNHEFDISKEDLQKRMNESTFDWLGANVRIVDGRHKKPFYKVVDGKEVPVKDTYIWQVQDADGTQLRIGFIGATINSNPSDFVYYEEALPKAKADFNALKDQVDVVLGLTHQAYEEDLILAEALPEIPLIMGGHEHENMYHQVGKSFVAKADANAKTVYVHTVTIDKKAGTTEVKSILTPITDKIPDDPIVAKTVQKWVDIQNTVIRKTVKDPYEVVYFADPPLNGLEKDVRSRPTNLGVLIAEGMLESSRYQAVASFFNSGGIRIDDFLSGDVLAIDLFRALPFGGEVWEVEIEGSLLKQVMDAGLKNKGAGGYLQSSGIEKKNGQWEIQGMTVEDDISYVVAINDFLLSGYESNLEFFTADHPGVKKVYKPDVADVNDVRRDIRSAVIDYLRER
jgi:5'-nucleotidase/UDP-sugar diphosphatase